MVTSHNLVIMKETDHQLCPMSLISSPMCLSSLNFVCMISLIRCFYGEPTSTFSNAVPLPKRPLGVTAIESRTSVEPGSRLRKKSVKLLKRLLLIKIRSCPIHLLAPHPHKLWISVRTTTRPRLRLSSATTLLGCMVSLFRVICLSIRQPIPWTM